MWAELREAVLLGVAKGVALSVMFLGLLYGPHLGAALAEIIHPAHHGIYLDMR